MSKIFITIRSFLIYSGLFLLVFIIIYDYTQAKKLLNSEPVEYSIAKITGIDYSGKAGPDNFIFTFLVDSLEINGESKVRNIDKNNHPKRKEREQYYFGRRYIVKYSLINPKVNRLLMDYPILDSLFIAPAQGWDSIPKHLVPRHPTLPKNYP